jgi:tRNA threonylcarbamoyladenosine biosynthesis protein TsaB
MRYGHGEALLPMIDAAMREAGQAPSSLGVIAVSVGPGGFTGIRVGLAAAQGIALATGARLLGITSFAAVAARASVPPNAALLVALDSRRADLYVQLFDADAAPLAEAKALLPADVPAYAGGRTLLIAGDAAEAAAACLADRAGIERLPDSAPGALGVLAAALRGSAVVAPRPLYLRPPDVTVPKVAPHGSTP